MSKSRPRAGARPRRTFTPAEELRHLAAYEAACQDGLGGGYLRREGLYSSQITEWRKLRDGGVLEGREPGANVKGVYYDAYSDVRHLPPATSSARTSMSPKPLSWQKK